MVVSAEYASNSYVKYTYPNAFFQFMLAKFKGDFLSFMNQANPASVLEVGSGEGFLLDHVAAHRVDSAFSGVDLSAQALRYAQDHCWPSVSLVQADIGRLPFRSRSFDLIMCSEVLEHLTDIEAAVTEIKRVARRHVLISVPLGRTSGGRPTQWSGCIWPTILITCGSGRRRIGPGYATPLLPPKEARLPRRSPPWKSSCNSGEACGLIFFQVAPP
jgi:ubiquinone/menaquinone biosynthesis C-methylase UbiE